MDQKGKSRTGLSHKKYETTIGDQVWTWNWMQRVHSEKNKSGGPSVPTFFFVGGGGIEYLTSKRSTPQDAFLDVQVKGKFIRVMKWWFVTYPTKRHQATCIVSPQTKKTSMRIFLTLLHWRVNCKFERQTPMLTKSDCHNLGLICLGMRGKLSSLKFF
jgi:hypothetical protein